MTCSVVTTTLVTTKSPKYTAPYKGIQLQAEDVQVQRGIFQMGRLRQGYKDCRDLPIIGELFATQKSCGGHPFERKQ